MAGFAAAYGEASWLFVVKWPPNGTRQTKLLRWRSMSRDELQQLCCTGKPLGTNPTTFEALKVHKSLVQLAFVCLSGKHWALAVLE